MAIKLKGINTLTNKLNKLSNVKAKKAVEEVSKIVENQLREEAKKFSSNSYKYIGEADSREYRNGDYYLEVGLKNDSAPWEEWKNLYFHHYGYEQFYFGNPIGEFTNMHQFWFTNAIDNMEENALKEIKDRLRKEIREAMK